MGKQLISTNELTNPPLEADQTADGEFLLITPENVKKAMAEMTITPELISDFLYITHILLNALNIVEEFENVSIYHLTRKASKLSFPVDHIYNITPEEMELIKADDNAERAERNGRLEYLDSVIEEGLYCLDDVAILIEKDLSKIFKRHKKVLSDHITFNVRSICFAVLCKISNCFGIQVSISAEKLKT